MRCPPGKHYRLVCWHLTYRLAPEVVDISPHIPDACTRARLPLKEFQRARRQWPREIQKVLEKRERRRQWLARHGEIPRGWAPPDPRDGRTGNYPKAALAARAGRGARRWLARWQLGLLGPR